jgi:hypothetical protein
VVKDIDWLQSFAQAERIRPAPSAGEFKTRLGDYLKALRVAKRKYVHWPTFQQREQRAQFRASLDAEIERVKAEHDDIVSVRHGSKRPDRVALAAVDRASFRVSHEQRKLNESSAWHRLAQLYFAAATGEDRALMHYLRKVNRERPRRLLFYRWDDDL